MSKPNIFETGLLQLVLENITSDEIFSRLGSGISAATTDGSLYVALHTADPGETNGLQTNSEVSYTPYARVAINRSNAEWTIAAGNAVNVNAITFPQRDDAGSTTVTHWSIGTADGPTSDVSSRMLWKGPLATTDTVPFNVNDTGSNALTNHIQHIAHGLSSGDQVVFVTYPGRTLPSGITEGVAYYVINTNNRVDQYSIRTNAPPGAEADIGSGDGLVATIVPQPITQNSTPQISAGNLSITED